MKKRDVEIVARIQRRHQERLRRRRENRRLGYADRATVRRSPHNSITDDVAALLGVIDRLSGAA